MARGRMKLKTIRAPKRRVTKLVIMIAVLSREALYIIRPAYCLIHF
jgi:hypothetical protein